jgi:hypothetical protein
VEEVSGEMTGRATNGVPPRIHGVEVVSGGRMMMITGMVAAATRVHTATTTTTTSQDTVNPTRILLMEEARSSGVTGVQDGAAGVILHSRQP